MNPQDLTFTPFQMTENSYNEDIHAYDEESDVGNGEVFCADDVSILHNKTNTAALMGISIGKSHHSTPPSRYVDPSAPEVVPEAIPNTDYVGPETSQVITSLELGSVPIPQGLEPLPPSKSNRRESRSALKPHKRRGKDRMQNTFLKQLLKNEAKKISDQLHTILSEAKRLDNIQKQIFKTLEAIE